MDLSTLSTYPNLLLAWNRINAGSNTSYKNNFRHLYHAYQLSFELNLRDLRRRIRDQIYQPHSPLRVYYPKTSGLQRPISFLSIEDQIVLQAIANIFTRKIRQKRAPLEGKSVFSNLLLSKGAIFTTKDWTVGCGALRSKLRASFKYGNRWIAAFDLSAFFDTISHDLLLKVIAPRGGSQGLTEFCNRCFRVWSSASSSSQFSHGIPQGPTASYLLAETVMLSIDQQIAERGSYSRYVDDILLMANDELNLRRTIVVLDKLCRDLGLIPRADKTKIRKLNRIGEIDDFVIPLERYYQSITRRPLEEAYSKKLVIGALNKSRRKIENKSYFRYAFFRAPRSNYLLRTAIRLWPKHPEHSDVFSFYFLKYSKSKPIVDYCTDQLLSDPPYDFICGELWKHLARLATSAQMERLIDLAIKTSKMSKSRPASCMGSLIFLCAAEANGLGAFSKFVRWKDESIVQAQLGPHILLKAQSGQTIATSYLARSSADPGLSLTQGFIYWKVKPLSIVQNLNDSHPILESVYESAGLIPSRQRPDPDPIKKLISKRFNLPKWQHWHDLLGAEYGHAHHLLSLAEIYYSAHPTPWLAHQDSFNDILFRKFVDHLVFHNAPGVIPTTDRNGDLIPYGGLLNDQRFTAIYPYLASNLRDPHVRRNSLPTSHPYDKKTQAESKPLKKGEQKSIRNKLSDAYQEIMNECQRLGI